MTMHKTLYPRDDFDRLYVSRKDREREHANIEDNVDVSIQWLEDYIEKRGRRLITADKKNTHNTVISTTKQSEK